VPVSRHIFFTTAVFNAPFVGNPMEIWLQCLVKTTKMVLLPCRDRSFSHFDTYTSIMNGEIDVEEQLL